MTRLAPLTCLVALSGCVIYRHRSGPGCPPKFLAVFVCTLALSGCALWQPGTMAYTGAALDVGTTAYALCGSDNYVEQNPLVPGDDCATVLLSSLAIKAGALGIVRLICRPSECPATYRVLGGVWLGAAAWNAAQIGD